MRRALTPVRLGFGAACGGAAETVVFGLETERTTGVSSDSPLGVSTRTSPRNSARARSSVSCGRLGRLVFLLRGMTINPSCVTVWSYLFFVWLNVTHVQQYFQGAHSKSLEYRIKVAQILSKLTRIIYAILML